VCHVRETVVRRTVRCTRVLFSQSWTLTPFNAHDPLSRNVQQTPCSIHLLTSRLRQNQHFIVSRMKIRCWSRNQSMLKHYYSTLLHFAWVVDDAKCILVTRVCVSVCVSVPRRMPTLLHGPGCNLGNGRGCPLVVHYWADLQSMHGFVAMTTKRRKRNVSKCLYSLYAWLYFVQISHLIGLSVDFNNIYSIWGFSEAV